MGEIHPTALIAPEARVSADAQIGPYCVIGPDVVIGPAVKLMAHVVIDGRTQIGGGTVVHPFAALGGPPQHLRYAGEPTELTIGSNCRIREYVTINRGTAMGGGRTSIGDDGFLMTAVHIAHDCHVGSNVIMANQATLGGHVTIGDHVVIGGLSAIHQHVRVGAHAMIGGMTGCTDDVVPFGMVVGNPCHLSGLNLVGLKRRGFDRKAIATLRAAYRSLFESGGTFADRIKRTMTEFANEPLVEPLLDFIRGSEARALCKPGRHHGRR